MAIIILLIIVVSVQSKSASSTSCSPDSCDSSGGPIVRFPFRLRDRQPPRCGYPGFNLRCDSQGRTILNLPGSAENFTVRNINYIGQSISITHDLCRSDRILNFRLPADSPFWAANLMNYIFLNCSFVSEDSTLYSSGYIPVLCLDHLVNYTVAARILDMAEVATPAPAACRFIRNVSVPVSLENSEKPWQLLNGLAPVDLAWSYPVCSACEKRGRVCGFAGDTGLETRCYGNSGLPRSAKYGIIIGVVIPGLLCIIGLVCYTGSLIKVSFLRHRQDPELPALTVSEQNLATTGTHGLDKLTIESYPKTVLGDSVHLPESSDGTCPICLCEYQPKDTLKSIPECNHCFHVGCIDEWLKLNGSCPLCRNSPDSSAPTSRSSTSLSSTGSLSSTLTS